MDAKDYQNLAARTLVATPGFDPSNEQTMLVWKALGLVGEAGEVAEHIKKGVFHQHGIDRKTLKKELGDVLWYIAALCTTLDLELSEVMEENIEKLKLRYPNGFSIENSKNRVDVT